MENRPHVLMLFLDGVGIGNKNPAFNPFFQADLRAFRSLLGGKIPYRGNCRISDAVASLKPINATLGVAGLPQSGTGQTTLLTGVNAAKHIGKHFGPYPYSTLKPIIEEQNIFKQLSRKGRSVLYANGFPPKYFEYINSTKMRMTAISYSWVTAGYNFNTHEKVAEGKALSADITAKGWNKKGFPPVPEHSPQEGGKLLAELTAHHNFVLFEYYLTDHAGHSQSMQTSIDVLQTIDGVLEGLINNFDFENNLFLMTSDHGNIEDLSTKSHTRNPVPLLLAGKNHARVSQKIKSLIHVTPAILETV